MDRRRVMIVAGEASGDLYGARLAEAIRARKPSWVIFGAGGSKMRGAGVRTLVNSEEIAVMGIVEVIAHLPAIRNAFRVLTTALEVTPPSVLVLIDYPDFNLRLAKKAKKLGVPIIYYISPQVWAWRSGRAGDIARLVQRMLVLFPFEVDIYQRVGLECRFVGHPLIDEVLPAVKRGEALARLALPGTSPTVALLPGSRKKEVESLLPVMLGAARLLKERFPSIRFIVPVAPTIEKAQVEAMAVSSGLPVTVVSEQVNEALAASDAAVVASGTATLQTALMGRAMVIVYTVAPFTYRVGKLLVKLDLIGLPNLVAGKKIVPELIQHEVTPERIAGEVGSILADSKRLKGMEDELIAIRKKLGGGGASGRVAEEVIGFVEGAA